jgi:hypothetical protein
MIARLLPVALAATILAVAPAAAAAADIQIVIADGPGVGFNDPTPVAPVGGNPGTTLGQQRRNAFLYAAGIWGNTLTSSQPILILAAFQPLACTATSAALGGAAPFFSVSVAPNSGVPGLAPDTWYPVALAEKLSGLPIAQILSPTQPFQAFAVFNPNIGQPGCLESRSWYYGLDTNTPANGINLATVLLHEFAHGLGFTAGPTNTNTGARSVSTTRGPLPSIWESRMGDFALGKTWLNMTDAERAASARNTPNLLWTGAGTTSAVPAVLGPGTELVLQGVPSVEGTYQAEPASGNTVAGAVSGVLTRARDTGGASQFDACEPIVNDVAGRIALVDRGTCTFLVKAQNAQAAGAAGVVIANDRPGLFTAGVDSSVTIPVVGISLADGTTIKSAPPLTGNGDGGVPARVRPSTVFRAGTTSGFARLYAPLTFQQGSSVSHFDTSLTPSVLMEPFITSALSHQVVPPFDLTFRVLQDIGW